MNGRGAAFGGALLLVGAVFSVYYMRQRQPVPPVELLRRVAESAPEWANYQEDIKAQIGATPVAEWSGGPIEVRRGSGEVRVTFELNGPWASRESAIPVLLRDPLGSVHRSDHEVLAPPRVTYVYRDPQNAISTVPWVELRYPHREQRVVFDAGGLWVGEAS